MIKAFAIASNLKYGYQEGFGSMIFKLFDKKCGENDARWADTAEKVIKHKVTPNQQLADDLYKRVNGKFQKRKLYSSNMDNSSCADLADTQLISRYNKEIRFILCFINIFCKYAWVIPLNDEKG